MREGFFLLGWDYSCDTFLSWLFKSQIDLKEHTDLFMKSEFFECSGAAEII